MKLPSLLGYLIFDERCYLCSSPLKGEKLVCPGCLSKITPQPEEDKVFIEHLDGYRTFATYGGTAREIVKLIKFENIKHLAREVGKLGKPFLKSYVDKTKADWITFVPTNPWRLWFTRGFDPVEEMLKGADQPYEKLIKRSLKWRKPLSRAKSVEERKKLVKGVFKLNRRFAERIKNKTVLVVDDILTSGTTASAVAHLLKAAGAKRVYLFAFFRTPVK